MPVILWIWFVIQVSLRDYDSCWSWKAFHWFFFESNNFQVVWVILGIVTLGTGIAMRFAFDSNVNYWIVTFT